MGFCLKAKWGGTVDQLPWITEREGPDNLGSEDFTVVRMDCQFNTRRMRVLAQDAGLGVGAPQAQPPVLMPAPPRFQFQEVVDARGKPVPGWGFDPSNPYFGKRAGPVLMVNRVEAAGIPSKVSVVFEEEGDRDQAQFSSKYGHFTVAYIGDDEHGPKASQVWLVARGNGTDSDYEDDYLEVQIRGAKQEPALRVAIWNTITLWIRPVVVSSGSAAGGSTLTPADVQIALNEARDIWAQAGLEFKWDDPIAVSTTPLMFDREGRILLPGPQGNDKYTAAFVESQSEKGKVLVVFIHALPAAKEKPEDLVGGQTMLAGPLGYKKNVIFISDAERQDIGTLAHELGHYVGKLRGAPLSHDSVPGIEVTDPDNVMVQGPGASKGVLYAQAITMRYFKNTQD